MILRETIFLLYVSILTDVRGSYYSALNYSDGAGIIYESIGEAGIFLYDFDVITSYNLEDYLSKYVNIQRYVERLTLFCKTHRMTMGGDCEEFLYAFNDAINYLERKHKLINNIVGTFTVSVRQERELFGGWISAITGLTDMVSSYIKRKRIAKARKEFAEKLDVIKWEVRNLLAIYEHSSNNFTSSLLNVSWEIDELFVIADMYTIRIDAQGHDAKLLTLARYLNSLIHLLSIQQSNLLDFLIVARQGMMHPAIMTPRMLETTLLEAAERVKYNPVLVKALQVAAASADEVYSTVKPRFYINNQTIEFALRIPLIKESLYNIHKLTSVPVLISNDVYGFIYPENPYLFVDKKNQRHFFLDAYEFDNCQSKAGRQYICKGTKPLRAKDFTCEHMLIFSGNLHQEKCDIRLTKINRTLFIELESDGTWIYVSPKPETINLQCNHEKIEVTIVGTGVFSVDTSCTRAETIEIVLRDYPANDLLTSQKYDIYRPDSNLTKHLEGVNTSLCDSSVSDMLLGRSETGKMKQTAMHLPTVRMSNLTDQPEEEKQEESVNRDITHNIMLYMLCLLCLLMLGVAIYLHIVLRKLSALVSKTRRDVKSH